MILELFITLVVIALAFIGIGVYSEELRAFGIIGSLFIFILGLLIILPNNLEIRNGANITTTGNVTTTIYTYDSYNDSTTHTVGYFLTIIGIFGMILIPIIRSVEED